MKLVLETDNKKFGGDIISLDRLLTILNAYRNSFNVKSPHFKASLEQWITYLNFAVNSIAGANLAAKSPQMEFHLPFEVEFQEYFKKAEKQINGAIRGSNSR